MNYSMQTYQPESPKTGIFMRQTRTFSGQVGAFSRQIRACLGQIGAYSGQIRRSFFNT